MNHWTTKIERKGFSTDNFPSKSPGKITFRFFDRV